MAASLQESMTQALAEIDAMLGVENAKKNSFDAGVAYAAGVIRKHLCSYALAIPPVPVMPVRGQPVIPAVAAVVPAVAAPAAKLPDPPAEPIPPEWEEVMASGFEAVKALVTQLMETGHKKDGERLAETAFSRGIKPPNKRAQA